MPTIIPTLQYEDANRAIAFLTDVLGFERKAVHEDGGRVAHAELTFGDGMVMLGEVRPADDRFRTGRAVIYVVVDDPDALHARATGAGADIAQGLTDQDYGSREFAVRDPEGNVWSFGTYDPA
jgi:uncharacterized glyoxalase superfamily protein PhnB